MSYLETLLERNEEFAQNFDAGDLPLAPKQRTIVLSCADTRVDPAHIFKLDLGEVVVIRNTGGRVTPGVINQVSTLAFMGAKLNPDDPRPLELIIVHHTQCGTERLADPKLQKAIMDNLGTDVSEIAIHDHQSAYIDDIKRLENSPKIPDQLLVSACLYDVSNGKVTEMIRPTPLNQVLAS